MPMVLEKKEIVSQCEGCGNADGRLCKIYAAPSYKWSVGACNMATHVKSEVVAQAKMANPLKASKAAMRGR